MKDSFWEKVEEPEINSDEIADYFGKKESPIPKETFSQNKKTIKSLLKPDRAKNIEIVLKKTKIPFEQIPYAIADIDENILTCENVESLLNIIPQKQEADEFIELRIGDPSEWTVADLFFCLISKITGY